jgi:hypothetical protein
MISNNLFSGISDRMASQVAVLKFAINSGVNNGTPYYKRVHTGVPTDGDYSVENALITAANALDTNTISGTLFKSMYTTVVNGLEQHVVDAGAESFDSWLDISGINVHPNFNDAWFSVKGSHLNAVNVFHPNDNLLVASFVSTNSGVGTYTAGTALGTGTGSTSLTNRAAAKFVLIPVQTLASEVHVNLRLTREAGQSTGSTADSFNIRLINGTISGTQVPVGNWHLSGVNNRNTFLNCDNIIALGGGASDAFRVYGLREREIRL